MIPTRAAALTVALGSFLMWIYCILRIFTYPKIDFAADFIEGYPGTFLAVSIGSFIIFLVSFFIYEVLAEIDRE